METADRARFGRRSTTSPSPCCVREESKRYGDATYTYTELTGRPMRQGIDLLEAALKTSPSSVVVAEPFLFNLCTRLPCFRCPLLTTHGILILVSHPIRASLDCRDRQEARAATRSRKMERRWSQNVLLKDAFELDVSCSAFSSASLHSHWHSPCVSHAYTTSNVPIKRSTNALSERACKVNYHS